jgi:hypothetical protein
MIEQGFAQQSPDTYRTAAEIRNHRNAEPQQGESVRWSDRPFGHTVTGSMLGDSKVDIRETNLIESIMLRARRQCGVAQTRNA